MNAFRDTAHRHERPIDITVGVRDAEGVVTLGMAAKRAAELAEEASNSGTFGVGGLFLGRNGKVFAEGTNAVVLKGVVSDPTGHLERQFVDWYYKMKGKLKLPEPEEMLIFSSLDPCAMCAGAMLKAGFNAVSVAYDEGVGIHEPGMQLRIPTELREKADMSFDLFPFLTQHSGFFLPLRYLGPSATVDTDSILERSSLAFASSFDKIREAIGEHRGSTIIAELGSARRDAGRLPVGIELPPESMGTVHEMGREALEKMLAEKRACMIDQEGNVVLIARSAEKLSPIRNSIMELIRGYTHMMNRRGYEEINLPQKNQVSFLVHMAPEEPVDALLQLGALGSFLESPRKVKGMPLLVYMEGDDARMQGFISHMAPYYLDKVSAGRLAGF